MAHRLRNPALLAVALAGAAAVHVSAIAKPNAGKSPSRHAHATGKAGKAGAAAGKAGKTGAAQPAPAANSGQASGPDVDALRHQYLELRDRLFRSRARAAAVASTLYSSRLEVDLDYTSARFYTVNRATIRLDGADIYDDVQGTIASNHAPRFEGYVAPGRHQLTVRIEATGKDDDRFKSTLESTFVVIAPAGKDLVVTARARDDGNIPYQFRKSHSGSYKLRLDVGVKTYARAAKHAH